MTLLQFVDNNPGITIILVILLGDVSVRLAKAFRGK